MHGKYQPPGGKLAAADVEVTSGRLAHVQVSGDFAPGAIHAAERIGAAVTGRRPPTLRMWEWAAPAVVIGSFQSLRNEIDADQARRLGCTVVRRISGGGAMFIEPNSTITYSLYAPESLAAGLSFAESSAFLDD